MEGRRGEAISSLVSGGCIISGAHVHQSLLFTNVRIHSYSRIHSTVVLQYCNIGNDVRLTNVVVDRGVNIPNGLVVGEDPELDKKRFRRTENGVCLITKDMIDKLDLT